MTHTIANVVKAFYVPHTVPTLRTFNTEQQSKELGITPQGVMT